MTLFQAGPKILPVIAENIPLALREGKRFVAWRSEPRPGQPKPAKMPYSPIMDNPKEGASSTNPAHWTTFENAEKYAEAAGLDGVMRAFDPSDELVGIDFDNCRDPETGELTDEATTRIARADTYTEISPSGTGVKMWVKAPALPPFGRKRGDVEMYCSGRFFTLTGHHLAGTPAVVGYRPDFVLALHREVFGDAPDVTAAADADPDRPIPALQIGDEDVLRLASESPHNGEKFRRLWSGDTSGYAVDGNDGESEAEGALCELLAYYGGPDRERIERLWLRSGLGQREKVQRADYRKRTIDLALRGKTRFHGDSVQVAPAAGPGSDGAEGCACADCPSRARVAFLEGRLLDAHDERESLLAANGTLSIRLTASKAEVERLNRRIYADYRLGKVKTYTSSQKEAIRGLVNLAPKRAEHFDTDTPIITDATLAAEMGKCNKTANSAAETVCSLPGSPITRAMAPGGKYGQVTTYELAVRDPVEILEQFVVIAESMEAKVSSRPQKPKCRNHPNAAVTILHECSACTEIVELQPLCGKVVLIAPSAPTVAVPVVTSEQTVHIATEPLPFPMPTRAKPWRCHCGSLERYPRPDGGYRCDGCGAVQLAAVSGGSE